MAHFMAKNGSRFKYSHNSCFVSVHAMDSLIKNNAMQMSFRRVDGKQVHFHAVMNYYYRPTGFEHFCLYRFYSEMKFIPMTEAEKTGQEPFYFTSCHPLHTTSVAVYRELPCIPVFPWNWLGSTNGFVTSLMDEIVDESSPDYEQKEAYAYKFMVLFMPFRSEADFTFNGSYQRQWKAAFDHGAFTKSIIEIAENIQTIHNSLDASLTPNFLSNRTVLEEIDESIENQNTIPDDYLTSIGEFFASRSGKNIMTGDADHIDPSFCGKLLESKIMQKEKYVQASVLQDVFSYSDIDSVSQKRKKQKHYTSLFRTTIEQLNSLCLSQQVLQESFSETTETFVETTETFVEATGSCESIESWGLKANFDQQQLTAFEIIAATYVLNFYDGALPSGDLNYNNTDYQYQRKRLCKLARRDEHSQQPLRMFVTGGGGAGKCKSKYPI